MFYGEYKHGLDTKGRLILPARFRDAAKENGVDKFFVTRGLDKCIFMFSEFEWRNVEQKFKTLSFTKEQARTFNRMFFSGAVDVVPDKQGRFVVPQYLKDYAAIKNQTVIIGVSNRIEIWDEKIWADFYAKSSQSFEQTAESLLDL
ncbi:MAG: division/cell wall cluster transcriptional repressor MraZ [Candidatus Omnitrophica bacterium]|nr:division/cell wall cluster transcriptional repressor MraZ [Candidatus Omnitrophota bacterium]